jgi:hypothetical protein
LEGLLAGGLGLTYFYSFLDSYFLVYYFVCYLGTYCLISSLAFGCGFYILSKILELVPLPQ